MTVLQADVCVVGAGPAGLALAAQLAGGGVDVLVLEAGNAQPPAGGSVMTSVRDVGVPTFVSTSRASGVGGSSLRWNVTTPLAGDHVRLAQLQHHDLAARGAAEGWPLDAADLQPYYDQAWRLFGVADPTYDTDARQLGVQLVDRRLFRFASASVVRDELPRQIAAARSARLIADAVVTEIRTDEQDDVVSTLRGRLQGMPFQVQAQRVVLAAGGLENARLLLASTSSHAAGIGNEGDAVGRYFMEHPHCLLGVAMPRPGAGPDPLASWAIAVDGGVARQPHYALSRTALERLCQLDAAIFLVPRARRRAVLTHLDGRVDPARTTDLDELLRFLRRDDARVSPGWRRVAGLVRALPALARTADRVARRTTPYGPHDRILDIWGMAEQAPDHRSRLSLTGEIDADGMPKAELDWRVPLTTWTSFARTLTLVSPSLGRATDRVIAPLVDEWHPSRLHVGYHHMGTTRMSRDVRAGVVDADCKVHGMRNLYIAGSSVFPTGGAVNPTLTIVALALRLAEHLAAGRAPVRAVSTVR